MQEIKEIHRILEELEKRIGGDTKGTFKHNLKQSFVVILGYVGKSIVHP